MKMRRTAPSPHRHRRLRLAGMTAVAVPGIYLLIAYLALPFFWTERDDLRRYPVSSMLTHTPQGIAGDPINVGLIGAREELLAAMSAAGWDPADAVTLRSAVDIGLSVLLDRPYVDAPVSPLLFDGRRQDLAFEKPTGRSADERHHVRFWLIQSPDDLPPLWLGSVSFDRGVGISHDTGQVTHHIAPDVDAERDMLMADLRHICAIADERLVDGRGATEDARNGGGDLYFTDGLAAVADLIAAPHGDNKCDAAED